MNTLTDMRIANDGNFTNMRTRKFAIAALSFVTCLIAASAFAGDARSEPQKTFDRNYENATNVSKRQKQEKTKEAMRDKSHDYRAKIGSGASVGVGKSGDINLRISTP